MKQTYQHGFGERPLSQLEFDISKSWKVLISKRHEAEIPFGIEGR
jgi:hypothetical protein